jgi:hypothetical protein
VSSAARRSRAAEGLSPTDAESICGLCGCGRGVESDASMGGVLLASSMGSRQLERVTADEHYQKQGEEDATR